VKCPVEMTCSLFHDNIGFSVLSVGLRVAAALRVYDLVVLSVFHKCMY
jgi:hypothetical protein